MSLNKQYIFGLHAVEAVLANKPERVIHMLVQQGRHDKKADELIQIAKQCKIHIEQVPRQELDRLTNEGNHQGVVVFCSGQKAYSEADIKSLLAALTTPPLILVLDSVQDPHNLGACFRSADAAGANMIIAPKDKATGITPVVSKVACGAAETVPFVQVTNLVRAIELLKEEGVWIYGAAGEATQTLYQTDLKGSVALVLGAEGDGLRRLTREHCDVLIRIPMLGTVSSLNVSVATGVMLFEVLRQRGYNRECL